VRPNGSLGQARLPRCSGAAGPVSASLPCSTIIRNESGVSTLSSSDITFLFTDIEGSTRLWEEDPGAMRAALARHDALLTRGIEQHGGTVVHSRGEGDSFFAVFPHVMDAVAAALCLQQALQREPWPTSAPLRVRVAIHTGEAELREGDYYGGPVNRCARLRAVAHGGQVLLSQAAVELLKFTPPAPARLRPLGAHRLRDLSSRESIYQLLAPGLPADFPPLNTLDVAFRRGLRRAASVSVAVLAVVSALAFTAVRNARDAEQARVLAVARGATLRRERYAAQMGLAQQAWNEGNLARAWELLRKQIPEAEEEDLRGFEWGYLWRLCQGESWFTLSGYTGLYNALAFSPDGQTLAAAVNDAITLWRVSPWQKKITLTASLPGNYVVAFSPDGVLMALGSGAKATLQDLATGREVATLNGHTNKIASMAFSPDGKALATGSYDHTVKLWDVASRKEVATLRGHRNVIYSVAFSPDGKTLATASRDTTVRLWDVASGRLKGVLGLGAVAASAAFSPDGKLLATGAWDGSLRLWNPATRHQIVSLPGAAGMVHSIRFSPDGKTLAAACADQTLKIWDLAARQPVATFRGHQSEVWDLAFSPDGKTLVSGSFDGTVRLWDTTLQREDDLLKRSIGDAGSVAFTTDSRTLAAYGRDGTVRLWNLAAGGWKAIPTGHRSSLYPVLLCPDGRTLISGSRVQDETVNERQPKVERWNVATGQVIAAFEGQSPAASPDGKILAAVTHGHRITLWDMALQGKGSSFIVPAERAWALAFSPDGKVLAIAGDRGTVHLWERATRRPLRILGGRGSPMLCLAFSPDGKTLAGGSMDNTVRLWDVARARETALLRGHMQWVFGVAFSPDGKTLASAGGIVKLWNVVTRQEVATFHGERNQVTSVAFSPDGRLLAAAGLDTTVSLWRAAPLTPSNTEPGRRGVRAAFREEPMP
jgi:WD40 repeat protein/class 3 adenylate cyclase